MEIQTFGQAISNSLVDLWMRLFDFLPVFIGALIVFLAGWLISVTLGRLIEKALKMAQLDKAMEKIGYKGTHIQFTVSEIIGGIVKWFLILVFLLAAVDILKLDQVTNFLNSIVLYIPNVFVAVIILATVFLLGNFVYRLVKGSTKAAGVMSATILATMSKWAIIIFGIFAALIQLGIASTLVSTIFIGIVAMLSLAGGLAFGLGGKDEAAMILRKLREEITEKND